MTTSDPWRSRIVRSGNVDPAGLQANPKNWRTHPPEQRAALIEMLNTVGYVQSVIINRTTGNLVDGHLRVELAVERGEKRIPVVYVELDEAEEARVLAALDPLAAMATVDTDRLGSLLREMTMDDGALSRMLGDMARKSKIDMRAQTQALADPDDIPETPDRSTIERGQLFQLGRHRMLVGDSTDDTDVRRLLDGARMDCGLMDPPYAIYGSASGLSSSITDDKIVRPFFRDTLRSAQMATREFAHVYIFCDWRSWPSWWEMAKGGLIEPKNLLVWSKSGGLGSNYANTYELIGYFMNLPEQKVMSTARKAGIRPVLKNNVLAYNRLTGDERQHNAAKPVGLLEQLIENSTDPGDNVIDLFLGSASTLIAAERLGRSCYGMEIDPINAAISIARFEKFTGEKARLLDA